MDAGDDRTGEAGRPVGGERGGGRPVTSTVGLRIEEGRWDDLAPEVATQGQDEVRDQAGERLATLVVSRRQDGVELDREVARVVDQGPPLLAALPPAVVGRVR